MIRVINDGTRYPLPRRLLKHWCKKTLAICKIPGEADISIAFISSERSRSLYSTYAARNKPTTVLTFPWRESEFPGTNEQPYLGEILIAPSVVAQTHGSGDTVFRSALRHITVHATLHLLGFDHGSPEACQAMEQAERRVLGSML